MSGNKVAMDRVDGSIHVITPPPPPLAIPGYVYAPVYPRYPQQRCSPHELTLPLGLHTHIHPPRYFPLDINPNSLNLPVHMTITMQVQCAHIFGSSYPSSGGWKMYIYAPIMQSFQNTMGRCPTQATDTLKATTLHQKNAQLFPAKNIPPIPHFSMVFPRGEKLGTLSQQLYQ